MTEKWYDTAPSVAAWTTRATIVRQADDTYVVTLAETAFYPKGGGQPSDTGTIAGLLVRNGKQRWRPPLMPTVTDRSVDIRAFLIAKDGSLL
ncbi:hypothetical protein B1690_05075 [Geobacillus sp. 46C-IIa]|uniref:hypothetical protein n=1 Tax=Geobacillus sp. 46C-IIa TaxID=1963025 RepID=UPI0009BCB581|nr:hypothetical protein B1690_05075 [Geobacillus sp. 46C-IIa]